MVTGIPICPIETGGTARTVRMEAIKRDELRAAGGESDEMPPPWTVISHVRVGNIGLLRPQKPLRFIRDGEVGGSGILHLTPTRYAVTTRMILH